MKMIAKGWSLIIVNLTFYCLSSSIQNSQCKIGQRKIQTADCRLFNKIMLSFALLRAKWSDILANWSKDFQYDQPE